MDGSEMESGRVGWLVYGAASLRFHFELCAAATRLGFFFLEPYAKPTSPHVTF